MGIETTDLERSILKTILWFSLFSQPLTVFEIWKWLLQPGRAYDLCEVQAILGRSRWLQEKLQTSSGFYALKDVPIDSLVQSRQMRFLDAERKFKRLRRCARFFRVLPGVRAVAAVNSLAWWGTEAQSDIDLYVVTASGSIWSSRFWLVLPFALTGSRPGHARKGKDPFCFSFFSTQESLQLEALCFPRDYYLAFWVKSFVPVFDRDGSFTEFHRVNRWVSSVLPNAHGRVSHHRHTPGFCPRLPVQSRLLESFFRFLQRRRMPAYLMNLANQDSRVVVTDEMLKFHDNDRRIEYRDRFEALVSQHVCPVRQR